MNRYPTASTRAARIVALVLGLSGLAAAQAADRLTMQYVEADKFVDIGFGSVERERNLKTLSDFLQSLATRLPEGQTLQLTVLDVDLAGETRPGAAHDFRVMRGRTDWPRVHLRYTLSQGGNPISQGEARISDMGYLDHPYPNSESMGALAYDKRMLQTWFQRTFLSPQP